MIIITIANQKGGVGKTTTAVTLADGLARDGMHTLLIDLDAQGNVADALGMDSGHELYDWLVKENGCLVQAKQNLKLIRSDKQTELLKMVLTGMDFREMVLINALIKLEKQIEEFEKVSLDYVIIDCAPSVDVLQTAALVAADYLIIPTKLDQFSIKGVKEMLKSLAAVRTASPSKCELAGILPTFYDLVTVESHIQLMNLAAAFAKKVWLPIKTDTKCRVANREGKTLWQVGDSKALEGYKAALWNVKELK